MSKDHKSEKDCCKDNAEGKLVKATELPIHGNPYPPKDVIIDDTPNALQLKITSLRTTIAPYTEPLVNGLQRASDFFAVGHSHLQTTIHGLVESQNSVRNAAIISTMGLIGFALARKRGIFKKLLYASVLSTGTTAILYPSDAGEKTQMLWYIAQNKLPEVAQQQYQKYFKSDQIVEQPSESDGSNK